MKIGYARVSTRDQHLDLQLDALKRAGCERIYQDVAGGSKTARPALDEMLAQLRSGDVIVIWKLDRLGRSLKHLVELVGELLVRKVGLLSLNDPVDTTSAQGRLVFNIFASLAEFERELIRERTNAGLAAARARGRVGGRPKGLPVQAEATAMAVETLYRERRLSVNAIAKKLRIAKSTLYTYLRHRGVEIGKYARAPAAVTPIKGQGRAADAGARTATIVLRLEVENKNKFVRGKKRARQEIELILQEYDAVLRPRGDYEMKVPYVDNDDLDQAMHDMLSEIQNAADLRHCHVESSARQEGTDRSW